MNEYLVKKIYKEYANERRELQNFALFDLHLKSKAEKQFSFTKRRGCVNKVTENTLRRHQINHIRKC